MASNSVDDSDDDILFIEEIKSENAPRTPQKQWRQRTLNPKREPFSNSTNLTDQKPVYPIFGHADDLKNFDLKDLSLLSPQVRKKNTTSDSDCDIIDLESDMYDVKLAPASIVKPEFKPSILNQIDPFQQQMLRELEAQKQRDLLIASLNLHRNNKSKKSAFNDALEKAKIANDPSQLNTEFNEDAESAVPQETYTTYEPKKLKLGKPHPDQVVETSSLASVEPPEIAYQLKMPNTVYERSKLSALQLEAVVYACQAHEKTLISGNAYLRIFSRVVKSKLNFTDISS
jgi:hypothetical protein